MADKSQPTMIWEGKPTDVRTIKELAAEALDVQDACNPLGVSLGFAKAMRELRNRLEFEELPSDTESICQHSIHQMWASKIHDLARLGLSDAERFERAYDACRRLAERSPAS